MRKTKRERQGARDAHQRACFIKVQVQNLSDCQVALCFWFHINVVSFLPPSPHLHCSIPHHVLLFAHFQVLPSHTHSTGNTAAKESLAETLSLAAIRFSISETFLKFCVNTNNKLPPHRGQQQHTFRFTAVGKGQRSPDKMSIISGKSAEGGAVTL